MGPIFGKIIPKHGSGFPKFQGAHKIVKNGPLFLEKSLKVDTFFCENDSKMGRGFEARVVHLHPNQIWVPPFKYGRVI